MSTGTAAPLICLISDGSFTHENLREKLPRFLSLVKSASNAGVQLVQIREKSLSANGLSELTLAVLSMTSGTSTKVLVNDRADVAMAAGADGVHLTSKSYSPSRLRPHLPSGSIIGISTHTVAEVVSAREEGADLAIFGPVFATPGKGEPVGLKTLREAVEAAEPMPVVAIGGIDSSNYRESIDAGAAGVASIRWLNDPTALYRLGCELGL